MASDRPPEMRTEYRGPVTDSTRWNAFVPRDDDIFICTPVKCGTTWTQAICAMLVFGTANHGHSPNALSPWIDARFERVETYLERVEAQRHRRFFKTHTPFDGIPYFESCTYLVVLRDPRDAYLSGLTHRDNWNNEELPNVIFPSGENAYENWLYYERAPGEWDIQSLEYVTHFLRTYWPFRELGNVHLYHYSDMVRDLRGTIASMAQALKVALTEAQLEEFTSAASFGSMKKNASQFAPFADIGMWHDDRKFFASGKSGGWKSKFSPDDQKAFDTRIRTLLSLEQRAWLLR